MKTPRLLRNNKKPISTSSRYRKLFLIGTAYIFEKSLVTFDGKPIYLPKEILGRYKDCKYLLTRDFQWKNFTVYLHDGKFVVEMKDGRVVVDRTNGNKVKNKFRRVDRTSWE